MCRSCWREAGSPKATHPDSAKAVEAIKALYAVHPVGGALHCELDDANLDGTWDAEARAEMLAWVVEFYDSRDSLTLDQDKALHLAVWNLMAPMSEEERFGAWALWQDYDH